MAKLCNADATKLSKSKQRTLTLQLETAVVIVGHPHHRIGPPGQADLMAARDDNAALTAQNCVEEPCRPHRDKTAMGRRLCWCPAAGQTLLKSSKSGSRLILCGRPYLLTKAGPYQGCPKDDCKRNYQPKVDETEMVNAPRNPTSLWGLVGFKWVRYCGHQ